MVDYKEPSLAFYEGGTIREESNSDPANWPTWVVTTSRVLERLPPDARAQWQVVAHARGWWYANKGKMVDVLIVRRKMPGYE